MKKKKKSKLEAEFTKLKLELKTLNQQKHFIKNAIMEKWKQPSNLEIAIEQIKNGEVDRFKNFEEYEKAVNADV